MMNTGEPLSPPSGRLRTRALRRITNMDRAKAVELYESGLSLNAVAERLVVSRYVVTAAVERAGVEFRDRYNHVNKREGKQ